MIDTNRLRGEIVRNGMTQQGMAKALNMSSKTFYLKMKKGVFGSDEIQRMIDVLHIENPTEIFFVKEVT